MWWTEGQGVWYNVRIQITTVLSVVVFLSSMQITSGLDKSHLRNFSGVKKWVFWDAPASNAKETCLTWITLPTLPLKNIWKKANHNNKNHLFTILSLAIFLWHRRFPNSLLSWNVKIGDNPHEEEEDELKKEDLSDFLLLWVSDFATRFSWFQVGWFLLQVRQVSVAAVLGVLLKGRHQIFLSIDGIPPVEE